MVQTGTPLRLGVIVVPARKLNETALRFLILAMNKEQELFQFEFYNIVAGDPLLTVLKNDQTVVRAEVWEQLPNFVARAREHVESRTELMRLSEEPPNRFVIVSQCRFDDNFYSTRRSPAAVIALGNWKRHMAPPSFLEFVQALLVREAVAALCPSLSGSGHLGNKGCLLDFTELLDEARQKTLRGYVCHHCRSRMQADGLPELAGTVTHLLDREWLGQPSNPRSPAGVMANLGYDLFTTKGRQETLKEAFLSVLRLEGAKQIVTVIGVVLVGLILYLLGLSGR